MSAPANRSRLLVFTGEGKGKTTAALGMVLRACGHGQRVLVVQFIKADDSPGEIAALRRLPGVELWQCGRGFVPPPTHASFPLHRQAAAEGLARVEQALRARDHDLVVLDELCIAIALGLLELDAVLAALSLAVAPTHLVLTGRNAPAALIEKADTVTEMRCIKHAFETTRCADRGVEW
jgi:cob(I)alamin adenosyltransferase